MTRRITRFQDAVLCLAGFVAGVYGGSILTGLSTRDLPEPQQLEWRLDRFPADLKYIASGKSCEPSGLLPSWEVTK